MFKTLSILRLFTRQLNRIAVALEQLAADYRLDIESRGLRHIKYEGKDEVMIAYGPQETRDEDWD